MQIYIIGFMGSGKSTFGKALAEEIGYGFVDLDKEIEKREKSTIQKIFTEKGEDAFRKAEHEALLASVNEENIVVATGGGAPCFQDNMKWMNDRGLTIYLKLFEGELKRRIEPEMEHRPLLKDLDSEGLERFVYNTLRERAVYYHQAKVVINPLIITPENMAAILRENYM